MRSVQVSRAPFLRLNPSNTSAREFDPSFNAVAKAWSAAPKVHRDNHFFATAEFDESIKVFQKVWHCLTLL